MENLNEEDVHKRKSVSSELAQFWITQYFQKLEDYYSKARKFFDQRPSPDMENCIKESLCALEACVEALTGKPASNDFTKVINQLKGNDPKQIPAPIAEAMIKLPCLPR